jgi:hypothetical protein
MTRHRFALIACGLPLFVAACLGDPSDPFTTLTTAASLATTNDTMDTQEAEEDTDTGTGDGDGDTTGDGDGDTNGDGDGDGDTNGDGDGDGDTNGDGDGDGEPGDGDGDGDLPMNCGWNAGGDPAGYYCGFMGTDPGGTAIECPPGLVDGDECGEITGAGCCDENGDNWYCADDGMGGQLLVLEAC